MEKHGVKLGFMSFFAKAVVEGLRAFPAINAEIRGDSVVYTGTPELMADYARLAMDCGVRIIGGCCGFSHR